MDLLEPLKLVSQGGAAVAVIVVVWLFLKQQDKFAALIQDLSKQTFTLVTTVSDKFTAALEEHRIKTDEKLQDISEAHNALVRDQITSSTQMTEAIKDLRFAVSDLQKKG